MQARKISRTDLTLSPIGFGTAAAGLDWDGEDADRLLEAYVAGGGNLIDTGHVYSDWIKGETSRSERVLGDWIRRRGRHDDIVLMTKGGHPRIGHMHESRMSRQDMTEDLNGSLEKLGVDCIDIYLYHRDDRGQTVEELIETMQDFVRQGKVRYYGCSNWTTERLQQAQAYCDRKGYRGFVVNQALYNIGVAHARPQADDTLVVCDAPMLEWHRHSDTLLMPFSGMCNGFFHLLREKGAAALAQGEYCTEENQRLAQHIYALCERRGCSVTEVLLGFFAVQPVPMLPLASAANLEQLSQLTKAMHTDFRAEDYAFLSAGV